MKRISLPYGTEQFSFSYDPERFSVLTPDPLKRALSNEEIAKALAHPIDSQSLDELAAKAKSALIVISDATRITRAEVLLPFVIAQLERVGLNRESISIMVATGNHRDATCAEVAELAGKETASSFRIFQHNSTDDEQLVEVNTTSRGTKAKLNRLLFDHDLVITISAATAHYFAGFGGGRKSIFPGLGSKDAIIHNHLLAIDYEKESMAAGVEPCRLDGNPLNDDLMEIVAQRPPDFSIDSILTLDHHIGALYCGHWETSHRKACDRFMNHHGVHIAETKPLVIASCGGYPKDIDLTQSHKTIQYATKALTPGGKLLLLACCSEGFSNRAISQFFPVKDAGSLLNKIRKQQVANGQTALALHQKTKQFSIGFVSSIPDEEVERFGLIPFDSIEKGLEWIDSGNDSDRDGFIIPYGSMTIPLAG